MIPDVPPFNNYSGNNYTTKFDYDLSIDNETQLVVLHTDSSEIQKELKLNVDYSIHGVGDENGGHIIFPLPGSSYGLLQEDEVISLYLSLPQEQQTPFGTSDKLDMNILEKTFDYIVKLIKIINRQVERSVKIQEGSKISPAELIESLKTSEVNAVKSALNAEISAQNAQESEQIATQKANEVSETYITAMADMTDTAREALDDIEAARQAGVNNIEEVNTDAVDEINNTKNAALSDINTLQSEAITDISSNLDTAKDELLNVKTEIITDLIENATGEALEEVENVKNTAITTINEGVESAKSELETLISEAENEANTYISNVETNVNNIVQNSQNAINEIKADVENKAEEFSQYALLAKKYAENPLNEEVENGTYSAKHWAEKAEQAAESVSNPLDKDIANITDEGKQKIVEIVEEAGISGTGSSYPLFTVNSNCSVASVGNPDTLVPSGERRYMGLINTNNAEVTSSDGTTFNLSSIPSYSYIRPQNGGLMIQVVFPIDLIDKSHNDEKNYSILLVSEDGQNWSLETANFIISPDFPGSVGEGEGFDFDTMEEITLQGDFKNKYYWIDTSAFPYKTYEISEYNDKYNPKAKQRYVIPMYDLHNEKIYPKNFDWFPKGLSNMTEDDKQKIKNVIASVGSIPDLFHFEVNKNLVYENTLFLSDLNNEFYQVSQNFAIEASLDNPFIATLYNGETVTITKDYTEKIKTKANNPKAMSDLPGVLGIISPEDKCVLMADVKKIAEASNSFEYLENFKWVLWIENNNLSSVRSKLSGLYNKLTNAINNNSATPGIHNVTLNSGALSTLAFAASNSHIIWHNTANNTFYTVIPIDTSGDYDSDIFYDVYIATVQCRITPLPSDFKLVPVGELNINSASTNRYYLENYGNGYLSHNYEAYTKNQFNWFNAASTAPPPYLKANMDNLTDAGREAIIKIIQEILQAQS